MRESPSGIAAGSLNARCIPFLAHRSCAGNAENRSIAAEQRLAFGFAAFAGNIRGGFCYLVVASFRLAGIRLIAELRELFIESCDSGLGALAQEIVDEGLLALLDLLWLFQNVMILEE